MLFRNSPKNDPAFLVGGAGNKWNKTRKRGERSIDQPAGLRRLDAFKLFG
jgi:hypothetical protein